MRETRPRRIVLSTVYISLPGTGSANGISSIEWSYLLEQFGGGDEFPNFASNIFNTGGGGSHTQTGGGKKKASNDKLHGGSQKDRDRDIKQYPKPFQKWYHREYKPDVNPGRDATPEELEDIYKDWLDLGQPTVKSISVWAIIGFGIYETVKWGVATLAAPETGGASLVAAGSVF
jgi:hypothetical protein